MSSADTVGAKLDKITFAVAVPAIEIEGVGAFKIGCDFFIAAGAVGGENGVPLFEGASRR